MTSRELFSHVYSNARRVAEAGKTALSERRVRLTVESLPDAYVLEDRVLFNAAPGAGALTVTAGTGTNGEGLAETPSTGEGSQLNAAEASAPEDADSALLAADLTVSVDPHDRIIASYDIGGGGTDYEQRKVGHNVADTGWTSFVEGRLQRTLDAGVARFSLHMPFGQRTYVLDSETGEYVAAPDERHFQFDAYLDAQVQVPTLTEDFVSAFSEFIEENTANGKLEEAIVYIGSPRLDADQKALIDHPKAWWDRAYDIVTPLLDAGFRSIGFDASAPATPDTLDFELHEVLRNPEHRDPVRDARLIEAIGEDPVKVYLEAAPYKSTGRTDFPLILLDKDWQHQDPERPSVHQALLQRRFFDHDQFTEEIVRMVRHEQWKNEGTDPLEEILTQGHTVAVSPSLLLYPHLGGEDSLEAFVKKMDLPSLPTLVDLDPGDINPETAIYTVTAGPKFGTLAPNEFHADVFTYTPDPYFTGVDSFEYAVEDASGARAAAVVTFFVNTDVVLPPDPPPPPAEPPATSGPAPFPPPAEPPTKGSSDLPDVTTPPSAGISGSQQGGLPDEPPTKPVDVADPTTPKDRPTSTPPPQPTSPPISALPPDPVQGPSRLPPDPVPPAITDGNSSANDDVPTPQAERPTAPTPAPFPRGQEASHTGSPPASAPSFETHDPSALPVPIPPGSGITESSGELTTAPAAPQLAANDARSENAGQQPRSGALERVEHLASKSASSAGEHRLIAPVGADESNSFVFLPHSNRLDGLATLPEHQDLLDELEESGLFTGATSMEILDRPQGTVMRIHYGSTALQFLLSSFDNWLPRR